MVGQDHAKRVLSVAVYNHYKRIAHSKLAGDVELQKSQKFFALDDVQLVFEPPALTAIARKALQRGTGARGLKSIIEDILLNSIFEVPSRPEVKRCVITEKSVLYGTEPKLYAEEQLEEIAPEQTA